MLNEFLLIQILGSKTCVGWVCCWFSHLLQEFFSLGTPVFPSPQKLTFPNSNSTRNGTQRTTMWLCYLPIYLEIKNKREKNIEKNYNHIDKNHIIWDFDLPFSSTELCCASFKYQTRKRLENIKLSFEGLLRITMCSGNLYTDSVMRTCLLYSDKWHGLEKATLDRWTCHKQQGDQEKTRQQWGIITNTIVKYQPATWPPLQYA